MAVEHINRKGKKYYLHQGTTKTGKPKYFFSMKNEGTLVTSIPDGFEIYENPNAQVFLQRIQPKLITDDEVATVESGMKKFSSLQYYQINVKKNTIYVYTPDQNVTNLTRLFSSHPLAEAKYIQNSIAQSISYSSMLRFVLCDENKRIFQTERFCFLGSIDDWIDIGSPDTLQKLIEKYVKHLDKESFYELH
ncbi:hypothetical protein H6G54_04035 [Anabaena cylindrica FACHB-243]|uniref:Uncharacterized protein n=1 Tax=Anabaena cylindrica (strain ATCC 27899 / PCC 7122) TaxID=272123 RepID=K9ZHS4_ANACC|nr:MULTISPECIES: hypothetical protein [Anabaena]AFZ58304.1 hypothetical protein Anacy_2880 [Anabaena cylindrica PCC 7122]MBD2416896.1 hypothetical protein [Anabaena cylindrica FACHB-243]MBY5281907.1 hypothetical protein [Anabaena sp. CCAP 1446/1C]MBY5308617.1 hypothetical protein [Anabaena sp. CCAP 1446/1C]MCM2406428.1 hypothetical protein [Anabaena sp. CCAP 1446/1C]